jgi:hypothetical protein
MEGTVKLKQAFIPCAIALAMASGLLGCEKDDAAAVSALEELTTELSAKVSEENQKLASLAAEVQTCLKDLANTKDEAVVITSTTAEVAVPSLEGEATSDSLNALKKALNDAADKQKAALAELEKKKDACAKDLEAARADAEAAAAEATAARKAAKKKKAGSKKRAVEESEAGQQREAEGRPATGLGSRHKKR